MPCRLVGPRPPDDGDRVVNLYTSFAAGRFHVNDRRHSIFGLTLDELLQLQADFNSGKYNSTELFEAARVRHEVAQ